MRQVDEKQYLTEAEGSRIYSYAAKRGLNKSALAIEVGGDPALKDPSRHLRAVLSGGLPLTAPYAERLRNALGCADADEFSKILRGETDSDAAVYPSFSVVRPAGFSAGCADYFYNGWRPTWEDLEAGFDINRVAYTRNGGISSCLKALLERRSALNALVILGVAGVGKSTLLRRAAYDAAEAGELVLTLNSDWALKPEGIAQQLNRACSSTTRPVLVVIDDISDHLLDNSPLPAVLKDIERLPITLLLAEHPDRWYAARRRLQVIANDNSTICRVHQLVDSECEQLVDRILQFESDGTLTQAPCNLGRTERLALCVEDSDRHLFVAMLQMRHGRKFRDIIETEFHRIPLREGQEAYALACYFETLRLPLPSQLLRRVVGVDRSVNTQEFFEAIDGLLEQRGDGWISRNRHIGRIVAKCALAHPAARQAALINVLEVIDAEDEGEGGLLLRAFSGEGVHKRFVMDLGRDANLLRQFYDRAHRALSQTPPSIRKLLWTSQGLAERVLPNPDADIARVCFRRALELDHEYDFAYRQLAWLELWKGNWNDAALHAVKAVEVAPHSFKTIYAAAKVLTLNTPEWFRRARAYWDRLFELEPNNEDVQEERELYNDCEIELRFYSGLKSNDLIPESLWKKLRPGIGLDKLRYGAQASDIRRRIKKNLTLMQQDSQGTVDALSQTVEGIDLESDRPIKGLFLANMARLEFICWRQQDSNMSIEELEQLFEDGIALNPNDPFAHCWYGTFLKDAKKDFAMALEEYNLSIQLGRNSRDPLLQDHPLFLNNLALLFMDEVEMKRRDPAELQQARKLLERAVARVPETKSDFNWPEHNLDWCKTLMDHHAYSAG